MTRRADQYRGAHVVIAIAALIAVLAGIIARTVLPNQSGTYGFVPASTDAVATIVRVDRGGAAERAGLRSGDVLRLDRMGLGDRLAYGFPRVGVPLAVPFERQGRALTARIVPTSDPRSRISRTDVRELLIDVVALIYAVLALLIALRAPVTIPSFLIFIFVLGTALNHSFGAISGCLADRSAAAVAWAVKLLSEVPALVAQFAFPVAFPPRTPRFRRALLALGVPATAAIVVFFEWDALYRFGMVPESVDVAEAWTQLVFETICAVAVIESIVNAPAAYRRQTVSAGTTLLLQAAYWSAVALTALNGWSIDWARWVGFIPYLAGIGMAYAVLRHRLVDLELFISRATIFSVVSLALISGFLLTEWAITLMLERAVGGRFDEHVLTWLPAAIALLVGLSARNVHEIVAHRLNRVFFAKRYRALEALHRFALETEAATDATALVDLTIRLLHRQLETEYAVLYAGTPEDGYTLVRAEGTNLPPLLDPNDELVLRLRRWGEAFRNEDRHDVFRHAYLCPMTVRGALRGFVVCGPKNDRSGYLPDEREALENLALRVGFACELLAHVPGSREPRSRASVAALARIPSAGGDG